MHSRRKLIVALGAGALTAPLRAFSQQQNKVWRVGFLGSAAVPAYANMIEALRAGLRDLGYVEGRDLVIEYRWAEGSYERLPELAAELVRLKVDVILAQGTPASLAAKLATTTVPIVMTTVADPIGSGLVASLAHPGGNITGVSNFSGDLGPKYLDLLLSVVPKIIRVAVLMNPRNSSNAPTRKSIENAGETVGVKILPVEAQTAEEIVTGFSMMAQQNAGAIIVVLDPFLNDQARQIAELAIKNRLPSIGGIVEYAEAGCLMSYGLNVRDGYRRAATFVDKILKGAKPRDLPVEQLMNSELVINMKTAKAFGIKITPSILVRADKVIE